MTFAFGTKGETLERLRPLVAVSRLCDQLIFPVLDWQRQRAFVLEQILERFGTDTRLVVRSSAQGEDGWTESQAGAYLSLTHVAPRPKAVAEAVDRVIASYGRTEKDDQFLIQPYVENVVISGVVMTRDLDTGGPYYVINYDDSTGRTDSVTGGAESKTILVHRSRPQALHSPRMRLLVDTVIEIEKATECTELDIEFCITAEDHVFALQVRPMAAKKQWDLVPEFEIDDALALVRANIAEAMTPVPDLAGETTVFGEMPDWNPAEMIGIAPKPLALSLYQRLITDGTWARARSEMGYQPVGDRALLTAFCGRPYIDVRLSLNSFLPLGLDTQVAHRLVSYQLARLEENPELHDRLEFAIAHTCLDFNFENRRQELVDAGLDDGEIAEIHKLLHGLSKSQIEGGANGLRALFDETRGLARSREAAQGLPPLERVSALLRDCIPNGILPFAKLARHDFIGISLLRSLRARNVFDADDVERFLASIKTIAVEIVLDMHALGEGELEISAFLDLYGHLRPGTYDILSARYDENPDLYIGGSTHAPEDKPAFVLSELQWEGIDRLLRETGYSLTPESLLEYIGEAIRLRELAKFEFTHNISDALSALADWGAEQGLSREDLALIRIDELLSGESLERLRGQVERARDAYRLTRTIRLPHIVAVPDDIDVIRLPIGRPTYITHKVVAAPAVNLEQPGTATIDQKVVLIECADPAFDWIFSHEIAGLVTKYGGANSHMSIRCAEFGIPAAIGCGERLFGDLARARVIEMNCGAHTIRVSSGR